MDLNAISQMSAAGPVVSADDSGAPNLDADMPVAVDPQMMARAAAFMQRVQADLCGGLTGLLCCLGDRLGLFTALREHGALTAADLAERSGIHARYAREWLAGMTCAGYLEFEPGLERFRMPPERGLVLADEGGMMFMGGAFQQLGALGGLVDAVAEAFRDGGGVDQDRYPEALFEGMERLSATWLDNLLVPAWLPSVPGLVDTLELGADVADVGCGAGRAILALAKAFPNSNFVGFDAHEDSIARARARARGASLGGRVRFEALDARDGLPGAFDLITTFDAAHDFVDPSRTLASMREALKPDGVYLMLEMNCSDDLEDDRGPIGTITYATSVLYNLPVARTSGAEGLGTAGLPEGRIRSLCRTAGFSHVRRVPIGNPINVLYEIRP